MRVDTTTGKPLWTWESNLGETVFHRLCIIDGEIFVVGTNDGSRKELCIIRLDESNGSRSLTKYVGLPAVFDLGLLQRTITTFGEQEGVKLLVWKVDVKEKGEDVILYSIYQQRMYSLKSLDKSFDPSCKNFDLQFFESDVVTMNILAIHCKNAETWVATVEEAEGVVTVDLHIVPEVSNIIKSLFLLVKKIAN